MTAQEVRFAIDGVTAIVIVSIAAAAAGLTWRVTGQAPSYAPIASALQSYSPLQPTPDLSTITTSPPFGQAVVLSAIPAELLKMTLRGVLLADPASASTALIAADGGLSAAYRIGEALPGGGTIERIDVDYVVIGVGGQFAALYFPGDERASSAGLASLPPGQAGVAVAPGSNSSGVSSIRALLPANVAGTQPPPAAVSVGGQPGAVASRLIDSLSATATPQGYRVGQNLAPLMRDAGLLPGDVVASVNGMDAARFASDPQSIGRAASAGQMQVEVVRDGSRITLTVPVR